MEAKTTRVKEGKKVSKKSPTQNNEELIKMLEENERRLINENKKEDEVVNYTYISSRGADELHHYQRTSI